MAHFSYIGLVGDVVSYEDSEQAQTVLDDDAALCEPTIGVYHTEDFGKGILKDEQLLEFGRGPG
jgi:hypothetical protein